MRLAILKHCSIGFHVDLLQRLFFSFGPVWLHCSRSFVADLLSQLRSLLFGFLSGNHDRRAHSRDLFIAMDLGHDVVNNVVEGIIEDVVCLAPQG